MARPRLAPPLQLVADAFSFLSLSRPVGFVAGAIPLVEIIAYHELFPSGLVRADFVELIRIIDAEYLKTLHHHHGLDSNHRNSNRSQRR